MPKPKKEPHTEAPTVRTTALELLCEVTHLEDKRTPPGERNVFSADSPEVLKEPNQFRTVGLPYSEVLRRLRRQFRHCKTSTACLRWYCAHLRAGDAGYENMRLPQRRPRASPKKGKK